MSNRLFYLAALTISIGFGLKVSADDITAKKMNNPFNLKNKIGFQLIFDKLDLDTHTKEFGISFYLSSNIEIFSNIKVFKEKYDWYPYLVDSTSKSNHVKIGFGCKKHLSLKENISPYYGGILSVFIPWRNRVSSPSLSTSQDVMLYDHYDSYQIQTDIKIPIGITWWITENVSIDISNQVGIDYCYLSVKQHNDRDFNYNESQSTTWEYGLIDFKFICSFYYDL